MDIIHHIQKGELHKDRKHGMTGQQAGSTAAHAQLKETPSSQSGANNIVMAIVQEKTAELEQLKAQMAEVEGQLTELKASFAEVNSCCRISMFPWQ